MMASNHPENEAPEKRVKDDAMQVDTVKDDKGDAMQEEKVEPDIDAGDENGDAARVRGFPNARAPFGIWTQRTGRLVQDPDPAPTEPVEQQPRYQPRDEERLGTSGSYMGQSWSAWFPGRTLYYVVGKDSCKIKIHYTGYPKKCDELIDLWAHPSASSSAVDPDAVQAARLRLPTDCAEVRELCGTIPEPEEMWDLGPESKPYALTATMQQVAMAGVPNLDGAIGEGGPFPNGSAETSAPAPQDGSSRPSDAEAATASVQDSMQAEDSESIIIVDDGPSGHASLDVPKVDIIITSPSSPVAAAQIINPATDARDAPISADHTSPMPNGNSVQAPAAPVNVTAGQTVEPTASTSTASSKETKETKAGTTAPSHDTPSTSTVKDESAAPRLLNLGWAAVDGHKALQARKKRKLRESGVSIADETPPQLEIPSVLPAVPGTPMALELFRDDAMDIPQSPAEKKKKKKRDREREHEADDSPRPKAKYIDPQPPPPPPVPRPKALTAEEEKIEAKKKEEAIVNHMERKRQERLQLRGGYHRWLHDATSGKDGHGNAPMQKGLTISVGTSESSLSVAKLVLRTSQGSIVEAPGGLTPAEALESFDHLSAETEPQFVDSPFFCGMISIAIGPEHSADDVIIGTEFEKPLRFVTNSFLTSLSEKLRRSGLLTSSMHQLAKLILPQDVHKLIRQFLKQKEPSLVADLTALRPYMWTYVVTAASTMHVRPAPEAEKEEDEQPDDAPEQQTEEKAKGDEGVDSKGGEENGNADEADQPATYAVTPQKPKRKGRRPSRVVFADEAEDKEEVVPLTENSNVLNTADGLDSVEPFNETPTLASMNHPSSPSIRSAKNSAVKDLIEPSFEDVSASSILEEALAETSKPSLRGRFEAAEKEEDGDIDTPLNKGEADEFDAAQYDAENPFVTSNGTVPDSAHQQSDALEEPHQDGQNGTHTYAETPEMPQTEDVLPPAHKFRMLKSSVSFLTDIASTQEIEIDQLSSQMPDDPEPASNGKPEAASDSIMLDSPAPKPRHSVDFLKGESFYTEATEATNDEVDEIGLSQYDMSQISSILPPDLTDIAPAPVPPVLNSETTGQMPAESDATLGESPAVKLHHGIDLTHGTSFYTEATNDEVDEIGLSQYDMSQITGDRILPTELTDGVAAVEKSVSELGDGANEVDVDAMAVDPAEEGATESGNVLSSGNGRVEATGADEGVIVVDSQEERSAEAQGEDEEVIVVDSQEGVVDVSKVNPDAVAVDLTTDGQDVTGTNDASAGDPEAAVIDLTTSQEKTAADTTPPNEASDGNLQAEEATTAPDPTQDEQPAKEKKQRRRRRGAEDLIMEGQEDASEPRRRSRRGMKEDPEVVPGASKVGEGIDGKQKKRKGKKGGPKEDATDGAAGSDEEKNDEGALLEEFGFDEPASPVLPFYKKKRRKKKKGEAFRMKSGMPNTGDLEGFLPYDPPHISCGGKEISMALEVVREKLKPALTTEGLGVPDVVMAGGDPSAEANWTLEVVTVDGTAGSNNRGSGEQASKPAEEMIPFNPIDVLGEWYWSDAAPHDATTTPHEPTTHAPAPLVESTVELFRRTLRLYRQHGTIQYLGTVTEAVDPMESPKKTKRSQKPEGGFAVLAQIAVPPELGWLRELPLRMVDGPVMDVLGVPVCPPQSAFALKARWRLRRRQAVLGGVAAAEADVGVGVEDQEEFVAPTRGKKRVGRAVVDENEADLMEGVEREGDGVVAENGGDRTTEAMEVDGAPVVMGDGDRRETIPAEVASRDAGTSTSGTGIPKFAMPFGDHENPASRQEYMRQKVHREELVLSPDCVYTFEPWTPL
ncbi:hypothetical protein HDU96_010724 [Phlyctochytrium bullatum]|nr:hypothetical protein HDU96_010724 [Phlyctochytrium bullatum]